MGLQWETGPRFLGRKYSLPIEEERKEKGWPERVTLDSVSSRRLELVV